MFHVNYLFLESLKHHEDLLMADEDGGCLALAAKKIAELSALETRLVKIDNVNDLDLFGIEIEGRYVLSRFGIYPTDTKLIHSAFESQLTSIKPEIIEEFSKLSELFEAVVFSIKEDLHYINHNSLIAS